MRQLISFLVLAGTFFLLIPVVDAAENKQEAYMSQWSSSCNALTASSAKICVMERHIFLDKANTKKLLTFGLRTASNEAPVMTIVLPLGVLLTDGVDVEIKKNIRKLPFIFCDSTGCIAQLRLDENIVELLSSSKIIIVNYRPINSKHTQMHLDITGFDDVYKKVKQ